MHVPFLFRANFTNKPNSLMIGFLTLVARKMSNTKIGGQNIRYGHKQGWS